MSRSLGWPIALSPAIRQSDIQVALWSAGVPYPIQAIVNRNGSLFEAVQANTGQDPLLDTSQTYWTTVSSGSGSTGYISNPSGGQGLTNVSTYADAASTSPVDGTGGSPNVTVAVNTTTPLDLTSDFLFTKDAANRQGQGVSETFQISNSDRGQQLTFTLSYKTSSNYADNDMAVFLYDITNSVLIPLSLSSLPSTATQPAKFSCSFFASSSLSYRVIFHVASTSALAYTVNLAKIQVSSYVQIQAAAIGSESTYTPTLTGVTSNPTLGTNTQKASWSRIGSKMRLFWTLNQTAAGSAGSGVYLISLPSGYTIDTTNIVLDDGVNFNGTVLGAVKIFNGTSYGSGSVSAFDSTRLLISDLNTNGSAVGLGYWNSANFALSTTVIRVSLECTIPISTWPVNINLYTDFTEYASNSATADSDATVSTSVPGPAGSLFPVTLTVARSKVVRFQRNVQPSDILTFEYSVDSGKTWVSADRGNLGLYYLRQNTVDFGTRFNGITGTDVTVGFARYARPASGAAYGGAGDDWSTFSTFLWRIRKISNGNTAEQPALVHADYIGSSAATINNPILYTTKVVDTHNMYSAGTFTIPVSGLYECSIVNGTTTNHVIELVKNGSNLRVMMSPPTTGTYHSAIKLQLLAGDAIQFRDITGTNGGGSNDWAQITRLGN